MASNHTVTLVKNDSGKSPVWQYFGFYKSSSGVIQREKAVCRLCHSELSYSGNTTNLRTHIERHHPIEHKLLNSEPKKEQYSKQQTLQEVVERLNPLSSDSERHVKLVSAIGNFIAQDMQPLSVVENKGFMELMKVAEPRFKVPSRGYFTKTVIPSLFSRAKEHVKEMLKTARFLCITTDLWTAAHSNRAYLCLTCHGIDSNWQLCSFCLATKELPVAHTAENIGEKIEEILDEWNIDKDMIVAAVTDNARNMINAINGMGFLHFPCMGHTLQLGILKAFDIGPVKAALARVSNIVSHFHRSSKATYSLKEKQNLLGLKPHMLKSSCVTRWGSTYEMLARFIEQQQAVCAVLLEDGGDRVLMPSSTEFAVIEELVDILKPFNDATEILSGDLYPTLGIVQPVFHRFLNDVLPSKPGDRDVVKKIKDAIRQNLSTRYQEEEIETILLLAMYLDPRFKKAPMLTAEKKTSMKSFMKYELEVYILDDRRLSQAEVSIVEQGEPGLSEPESRAKRTKLEKFFGDTFVKNSSEKISAAEAAEAELQKYELEDPLSLDSKNPLLWWKEREINYKFLSILAKRFLCITSTSVPSERLFSSAGNLLSERRSRLSPENVEKLLFLYENNKLLNTNK